MDQKLLEIFKQFRFLKLKDILSLYSISNFTSFAAGDYIVRKGERYNYVLGIRKGIIRTYIMTTGGEERTVRFAKEGDFASSYNSILNDQPSTEYLQAVEDCKVVQVDLQRLRELSMGNIRLMRLWNNAISEALEETIHRVEFFVSLSPEERYRLILAESPDLVDRIPQKYLASYIGVTTVSLSRIRKRVSG